MFNWLRRKEETVYNITSNIDVKKLIEAGLDKSSMEVTVSVDNGITYVTIILRYANTNEVISRKEHQLYNGDTAVINHKFAIKFGGELC